MRLTFTFSICLLLALNLSAQPAGDEWMNLQVNEINRLPVHTSFFAFDTEGEALKQQPEQSGRYLS